MNKVFHIVLALAALLCSLSCNKAEITPVVVNSPIYVSFDARLSNAMSKAGTGDGRDSEIASIDVLLFRLRESGDTLIEQHARGEKDSMKLTVQVVPNVPLLCCIVANAPKGKLDSVTIYRDFRKSIDSLSNVAENDGRLLMLGDTLNTFTKKDKGTTVEIAVRRLAAKISIKGITFKMMDGEIGKMEVILEKIFVTNVCTDARYDGTPFASADSLGWENRMGLDLPEDSPLRPYLVKDINKEIKSSETLADLYEFYVMPNPYNNGVIWTKDSPEWSPRNTRVVAQVSIGGVVYYYPVTLASQTDSEGATFVSPVESNKNYVVTNLILKDFGSTHPDVPVTRSKMVFTVDVNPWGEDKDTQTGDFNKQRWEK